MAKFIYANTETISEMEAQGLSVLFNLTYVKKVNSSCYEFSGAEGAVDSYLGHRLFPKTLDGRPQLDRQVVFTRFPLPEQRDFFKIVKDIAAFSDGQDDLEETPNVPSTTSPLSSPSLKSTLSPSDRPKSIHDFKDIGFSPAGPTSFPKASPPAQTPGKVEQGNPPHNYTRQGSLERNVPSQFHPEVAARRAIPPKEGVYQGDSTSSPECLIFSRCAGADMIERADPPKKIVYGLDVPQNAGVGSKKQDVDPRAFFNREDVAKKVQHNEYNADDGAKQVEYPTPTKLLVFDEADFVEQKISEFTDVSRFPQSHPIYMKEWNARAWSIAFKKYQENLSLSRTRDDPTDYSVHVKCMRVIVMLNTLKYIREGEYRPSSGSKQLIRRLNTQMTTVYQNMPSIPEPFRLQETVKVKVVNEDCLVAAQKAKSRNPNDRVCVLNMASALAPGGGYKKGEGGQEDSIMRRTNYCTALDSAWDSVNPNADEKARGYHGYPIGGAYTRSVTVFRDTEDKGYELLSQPFECDFVAAYASKYEKERPFIEGDVTVTLQKIRAIFGMAVENRADVLVLGAFGCGAYRNDPSIVVQCFHSALHELGTFFKKVIFAVVDKSGNQENYKAFRTLNEATYAKPKIPPQFSKLFCPDGGRCPKINDTMHCVHYSHPSACPDQNCQNNDLTHKIVFGHVKPNSAKHEVDQKLEKHGIFQSAKQGLADVQQRLEKHGNLLSPKPGMIGLQQNAGKQDIPAHGDLPACAFEGPDYWCSDAYNTQKPHYQHFRHTCRFGIKCRDFNNPEHNRLYIHKSLPPCSAGENCTNVFDYKHRQLHSHPNLPDILIPCRHDSLSLCQPSKDEKHILHYKHKYN